MKREEILWEIKDNLGLVPEFLENLPDESLEHEWSILKSIELSESNLSRKVKALIGVGVSAALRCRYCTLFYTEAARRAGVLGSEIQEALLVAKNTAGWSTYLNGSQYDYELFQRELEAIQRFRAEKTVESIEEEKLVEVGAF